MKNLCIGTIIVLSVFFAIKPEIIPANELEKGIYATLVTNMGNIVCELYEKDAPLTTANFVGLATGTKEHLNYETKKWEKGRFYDGLIFHRVIPGFMIQGGCPFGTGMGDPGYRFSDEFSPNLKHDKPGVLSMANSGPDTNGSQFFITVAPTPWLDNKHTIFGQVVEGMEVVYQISNLPKNPMDKPIEPVIVKQIDIKRVGGE